MAPERHPITRGPRGKRASHRRPPSGTRPTLQRMPRPPSFTPVFPPFTHKVSTPYPTTSTAGIAHSTVPRAQTNTHAGAQGMQVPSRMVSQPSQVHMFVNNAQLRNAQPTRTHREIPVAQTSRISPQTSHSDPSRTVGQGDNCLGRTCSFCRIFVGNDVTWKVHKNGHNSGARCNYCNQVFLTVLARDFHHRYHWDATTQAVCAADDACLCRLCKFIFYGVPYLEMHLLLFHGRAEMYKIQNYGFNSSHIKAPVRYRTAKMEQVTPLTPAPTPEPLPRSYRRPAVPAATPLVAVPHAISLIPTNPMNPMVIVNMTPPTTATRPPMPLPSITPMVAGHTPTPPATPNAYSWMPISRSNPPAVASSITNMTSKTINWTPVASANAAAVPTVPSTIARMPVTFMNGAASVWPIYNTAPNTIASILSAFMNPTVIHNSMLSTNPNSLSRMSAASVNTPSQWPSQWLSQRHATVSDRVNYYDSQMESSQNLMPTTRQPAWTYNAPGPLFGVEPVAGGAPYLPSWNWASTVGSAYHPWTPETPYSSLSHQGNQHVAAGGGRSRQPHTPDPYATARPAGGAVYQYTHPGAARRVLPPADSPPPWPLYKQWSPEICVSDIFFKILANQSAGDRGARRGDSGN